MRPLVDGLAAVRGDDHDVLYARAPVTTEVDSRFDAEGHPVDQFDIVPGNDVRLLMHRQPDAMPGPV